MSEYRVTRVLRIPAGPDTYRTATDASEAAHRLNVSHPHEQYAIAHVTYPLDSLPLNELAERLERAAENLELLVLAAGAPDSPESLRIAGKAQGVHLALSYIREIK